MDASREPAAIELAVCAEMVFLELPVAERVRRIDELGFQVEIWDWTVKDVDALAATGAMWLTAARTLDRVADLGERAGSPSAWRTSTPPSTMPTEDG
jgi:hydroxypyruvate isomerase